MPVSPFFTLLYSVALTIIAVASSLVSQGFGWRSRGRFTGLRRDSLADSSSLTKYHNIICGMYCTGCILTGFIPTAHFIQDLVHDLVLDLVLGSRPYRISSLVWRACLAVWCLVSSCMVLVWCFVW